MVDLEEDGGLAYLKSEELRHFKGSREAIKTILNKVGYFTQARGDNWASSALRWWRNKNRLNLFGTEGLTWDSDCPPGYESNPSIFGKPCLKKCGPRQERNLNK